MILLVLRAGILLTTFSFGLSASPQDGKDSVNPGVTSSRLNNACT
jgi:hypothetical protein